jgi:phosphoribosylamine--glycine ligase
MPRITSDLLEVLKAAANEGLTDQSVAWSDISAVDVVLAAPGYPDAPRKGLAISGLEPSDSTLVFHAGTKEVDGALVSSGGRVLNVVGLGDTIVEARDNAYSMTHRIEFEGKQFRTDIAADDKRTSQ